MHTSPTEVKRTSLVLPASDHARLSEIAKANDRDFSKQVRFLIKQCIAQTDALESTPSGDAA